MKIFINGRSVAFTNLQVTFNYDAIADTFSFNAPNFGESFWKPLTYPSVIIRNNNGIELLSGKIINVVAKVNGNESEVSVTGYSHTGILNDCPDIEEALKENSQSVNGDTESSEDTGKTGESSCYSDTSLLELAKKLCAPYNIAVEVDSLVADKVNEAYEQTTTKETDSIAAYLGKLATLKNVVLRGTRHGTILFTQVNPGGTVKASFSTGDTISTEFTCNADGQKMHNKIYMSATANLYEEENKDQNFSGEGGFIINPLVKDTLRQTVKKQGIEINLIKDVTKAALADQLKNIYWTIERRDWNATEKGLLTPGDLIKCTATNAFLYGTTLLVREIQLSEDAKGKKETIKAVLPETMTGETPTYRF